MYMMHVSLISWWDKIQLEQNKNSDHDTDPEVWIKSHTSVLNT